MKKWTFWAPLAVVAYLAAAGAHATTISVEGNGTVTIPAEYATLSATTEHLADTAEAAQRAVDEVMANLLDGLEGLPVDEDSIDAGQLRIQPQYRWNPRNETQEFIGYEATRELSFKLTDLNSLGEALQMLSREGADTLHSPSYGSSLTESARSRALTLAFGKAKSDAESLADAAGLVLGEAVTISTGARPTPIFRGANRMAPAAMSADRAPRYEPGKLSVSASVSVIFNAAP